MRPSLEFPGFGAHLIVGEQLQGIDFDVQLHHDHPHVTHDVHDDLCHVVYLYSIC